MDYYHLALYYLLFLGCYCQDKLSFQSSLGNIDYPDPDSYGYRYCGAWNTVDGKSLYSTCDPFKTKRCGKPLDITFQCCSGFMKVEESIFPKNSNGKSVCGRTIPQWKSCDNILKTYLGKNKFSRLMETVVKSKTSTSTFTAFVPEDDIEENNKEAQYHIVEGKYYPSSFQNDQILTSVFNGQKLQVTKQLPGIVCINCIEITRSSIECQNGVIHFISKPLTAISNKDESLMEKLQLDPEINLFVNDIPSQMKEKLNKKLDVKYTVLAVPNEKWRTIKNKYSGILLDKIVKNHILSDLYCSMTLAKSYNKIKTKAKETIKSFCAVEGKSEVKYLQDQCGNKRKLSKTDVVASNGVYHVIEDVLLPTSVKSMDEIIKDNKCTSSFFFQAETFMNSIKDCDLRMKPGKKYTILLPIDKSFDWWSTYAQFQPEYERFQTDKEYRCRVARYHVIEQNPELNELKKLPHEQKGFKTNNKDELFEVDYFLKDKDQSNLYFHYSPVVDFEAKEFSYGSIFRISRINVIPEKFIVDILKENPNTKITSRQVNKTDMDKKVFKPNKPLNLFLATVDDGLKDLSSGKIDKIIEAYNGDSLSKFLLLHTVPYYLWGGDIGYFKPNTVHKFMSKAGIELIFWRDSSGTMKIGYEGLPKDKWAEVIKFNLPAKDGIVWLLKRFIKCPTKLCPHKIAVIDYDLFDVFVSACHYKEIAGITDPLKAKENYNSKPIKLAENSPDKCVIYKQPTWKASKKIST